MTSAPGGIAMTVGAEVSGAARPSTVGSGAVRVGTAGAEVSGAARPSTVGSGAARASTVGAEVSGTARAGAVPDSIRGDPE